ncbi:unnamed protein product [Paramecium octaurelia]|uniref:Uncharacterized protein n=1 Tax=Paramecium octaurelia TaxID=43137 RepID=A0A8S1SLZ3_PAROT|nr:unnamed protein product [Paramecium octaurelia]
MEQLIQNNLRQDIQSLSNSNYSNSQDQIKQIIRFQLKYQHYQNMDYINKQLKRVRRNKQQVQENFYLLIDLYFYFNIIKSIFIQFFQKHKFVQEIIKLSNIFDKQFDIHQDQQMTIFKQYYLVTLVELVDIQEVMKETNNIFNQQTRKTIQDELYLVEKSKRGKTHQLKGIIISSQQQRFLSTNEIIFQKLLDERNLYQFQCYFQFFVIHQRREVI